MRLTIVRRILAMTITLLSLQSQAQQQIVPLTKQFQLALQSKDFLSARVLIKNIASLKPNRTQWNTINKLLISNEPIGYDIIYKWGALKETLSLLSPQEKKIRDLIRQADQWMLEEQFQASFSQFQKVAKTLKEELKAGDQDNFLLYQSVIHSMSRALYGAGRYHESVEVNSWIDPRYPKYRQVLFERMWEGFRAHNVSIAMGAIASQRTVFFAQFLEPETYLLMIYLLKSLCRTDQIEIVRAELSDFQNKVKSLGTTKITEWARFDLEYFNLYKLINSQNPQANRFGVTQAQREKEKEKIRISLLSHVKDLGARLSKELDMVKAYASLAISAQPLKANSMILTTRDEIAAKDRESWKLDDAEDWVDETGRHLYVGTNLCIQEAR